LRARAAAFSEELLVVDLDQGGSIAPEPAATEEAAYRALVLGLRDYARKCGFQRAVLGLSGGIDSALTAVIAADALGPANVLGVAMPTRYSSPGSIADARILAENLGIGFRVVDIDPIFSAYLHSFESLLSTFSKSSSDDVTLENIQARIRGATVMAISNRTGALVLTTGNKSELAVGYCTLYGDMVGGLAVISDLPKTLVYHVSHYVNSEHERIPMSTMVKPPSAELRPNQTDQDSLPPYDLLDSVLELYVEEELGFEAIIERGFERALVTRVVSLIERAEYKRRQAAPGLILTRKAFGPGRRMPIANGYKESS
jgi:NAD+ synthetase